MSSFTATFTATVQEILEARTLSTRGTWESEDLMNDLHEKFLGALISV